MTVPPGYRDAVDFQRTLREIAPHVGIPVDFTYSAVASRGQPALRLHVRFHETEWVPLKLELQASAGRPLTSISVRVPLARILQEALIAAAKRLTYEPFDEDGRYRGDYMAGAPAVKVVGRLLPDGTRRTAETEAWLLADAPPRGQVPQRWELMTDEELAVAVTQLRAAPRRLEELAVADREAVRDEAAQRRRTPIPMTNEDLAVVADRYRTIVAQGRRNPTVVIAKERNVSRMTASRWLRRARDLGLLEEAEPGTAQLR